MLVNDFGLIPVEFEFNSGMFTMFASKSVKDAVLEYSKMVCLSESEVMEEVKSINILTKGELERIEFDDGETEENEPSNCLIQFLKANKCGVFASSEYEQY